MERLETDHLLGPDVRRIAENRRRYVPRNRDPETVSFAGSSISGASAFSASVGASGEDLEFREILPGMCLMMSWGSLMDRN